MINKTALFLFWCCLVMSGARIAEGKVTFDAMTFDFGKVKRGEKLSHSFTFKNSGEEPLMITGVHATCGCTVSQVDVLKSYKSGETGTVVVSLDTTNFAGSIVKTVTVMSNERLMPTRNLTLKAYIEEEFSADPPLVDFGQVGLADNIEKVVKITNHKKETWQSAGVRFNPAVLAVRTEQKDDVLLAYVKLQPNLNAGFIKETVFVKIPGVAMQEIPVLVRADLKGSIRVATPYLEFGSVKGASTIKREIKMQRTAAYTVESTTAELNINGVKIPNVDDFIKTEFADDVIGVKLTNSKGAKGSVHGRLVLHTNDPAQKQLKVDFYAFFNDPE